MLNILVGRVDQRGMTADKLCVSLVTFWYRTALLVPRSERRLAGKGRGLGAIRRRGATVVLVII
jgi:hypothetical protein